MDGKCDEDKDKHEYALSQERKVTPWACFQEKEHGEADLFNV